MAIQRVDARTIPGYEVDRDAYTIKQAAADLGVAPTTIYQWIREGKLRGRTTACGNGRWVSKRSVDALVAKRAGGAA